ncbi:MAG: Ni/Fe hydrogenase subunit alpha [Thermodesulfovibrionales bacterium]|nr:Ni/Fe hydrogenase subunit alpha [Thermodesulfovibrionales bacterium]
MTTKKKTKKRSSELTKEESMPKELVIEPVTRIEGHGKVTIFLDQNNEVKDARFAVTQFRGFERFVEGRPFTEMPSIVERICGICPVSHSLAASKACDAILGVRIPNPAIKIRRLLNCGEFIQSHALSFFHLSSPDLLLGFDSNPAERNIVGVIKANPEIAKSGIRLRQIGGHIVEWLGKKRVHPAWVVPGGVNEPLSVEHRDMMLKEIPEALEIIQKTLRFFKGIIEDFRNEIRTFGNFPSMFLGLVDANGNWEITDGYLRFIDSRGHIVADMVEPSRYKEFIGEAVEEFSYLKSPYYKPLGYPKGMYRVGPLARLNVCNGFSTPLANREWAEFRDLERGPVLSSFYNHYARLIEILAVIELEEQLLNDPEILDPHIRAHASVNELEGVGCVEAPRGTLFHHYRVSKEGLMQWANMIVATGNNNLAINQSVLQVAQHYVKGDEITEPMINRIEAVIRAYDPCLSCSTHALGKMPLQITLKDCAGRIIKEVVRT